MGVSGGCGFDTSATVVVRCCNGWCGRLNRLLRLDSAAANTWAPPTAARPAAAPVIQAVAAVTIRTEILKLMTIIRIKTKNNITSVN